jgi:hypothetical protein
MRAATLYSINPSLFNLPIIEWDPKTLGGYFGLKEFITVYDKTEEYLSDIFDLQGALVHKAKNRRIPCIKKQGLCDRVTFRHSERGHFVERQTTNESLRRLSFQETSRKLVTENGFQAEHDGFRQ